jgi:hypothetical protein
VAARLEQAVGPIDIVFGHNDMLADQFPGVRPAAKALLIVRTTRGAANELAREVAKWKDAAWLAVRRS